MKKLRVRLGFKADTILLNSYTTDGTPKYPLRLLEFTFSETRAVWTVSAGGRIVSAAHGVEVPLNPDWAGSWITLATPIIVHVKGAVFRPDFIIKVPGWVVREEE